MEGGRICEMGLGSERVREIWMSRVTDAGISESGLSGIEELVRGMRLTKRQGVDSRDKVKRNERSDKLF